MGEILKSVDQEVFLFLNGLHHPFLDTLMYYGTQTLYWLPLFLFLLYLLMIKYGWKTAWILLIAIIMITVSDQLSNFFKDLISRPRPSHEPGLGAIHLVKEYRGGQYGFYSAHASSTLALAIFLIRVLKEPFRGYSVLMLCWAFFMAYTRIYLGVHYPGDILAGWIAGGLLGWLCSSVYLRLVRKKE